MWNFLPDVNLPGHSSWSTNVKISGHHTKKLFQIPASVLRKWTILKKILESPLDCKEIQPVHPKGDQSWVFTGRTDAEAEAPIIWLPHAKSWLIWKDPDAGRWDGWMASLTQWTWVWVNSGSWWWTGRPGVLQFMESQSWTRLSDWTELNCL